MGKKFLKFSLLTIFCLLLITFFLFFFEYRKWYRELFKEERLICIEDLKEEDTDIDEKTKQFILSDSRTEFIVLTDKEVLELLKGYIEIESPVNITDICILPNTKTWQILFQYEIWKVNTPWISFSVVKDDRETAELYISNINIGKYKLPFGIEKRVKVEVNRGISDALLTINENKMLGRVITNIELLEDKAVIKGTNPLE